MNIRKQERIQRLESTLIQASLERQPPALERAEAGLADDTLADTNDARLADEVLGAADGVLQALHLLEGALVDGALLRQAEEARDRLGVEGGEAVDDARGAEEHDGRELLAEAAVDAEFGVVDARVGGDLDVEGDVSVGPGFLRDRVRKVPAVEMECILGSCLHFATNDLGVLGEVLVRVGLDEDVVCDAGVVVSMPN